MGTVEKNALTVVEYDVEGVRVKLDPDYQYTGRCELNTEKTNEVLAQIVISCNCDPYKTKSDGTGGVL